MSTTSYDVRVYKTWVYRGKKANTYYVRWSVSGKRFKEPFRTSALADSFRSDLVSAQRRGEAFDGAEGRPVSMMRATNAMSWFEFACKYVDMKWPQAAGKSRAGNADSLATVTPALLANTAGKPEDKVLRRALTGWAFNTKRRGTDKPIEIEEALRWLQRNTVQVSRLMDTAVVRSVFDQLCRKLDGEQASAKTIARKRAVLFNALDYAVELKLLDKNPVPDLKWTAPKIVRAIDKRVVINPQQATRLLDAVGRQKPSGPKLVGFFATMYYSALRPEEAAMLRKADLQLPERGWGELLLSQTAPTTGAAWTDSGQRRDRRQLKQRGEGEVRPVPCPPPLTEILHRHLSHHGTAADGRLFRNLAGGDLAESTIGRVWDKARKAALSEGEYASPLARRPYDLRHAAVSTWLASGVDSTQCAEWAGHSVAVLHQIYAKVIAGREDHNRRRIEDTLGWTDDR